MSDRRRRLSRRVVFMAALGSALSMALTQTALAAPPSIVQERNASFNFPVADCGSFLIAGDWLVNTRFVTYYDASGQPIREAYSARWQGDIANSVSGKSIDDSGSFANVTDLLTGELRSSGVVRHDTVPQLGIVWLDAGLVVVDASGKIVFSTTHTLADPAAACAYLGA